VQERCAGIFKDGVPDLELVRVNGEDTVAVGSQVPPVLVILESGKRSRAVMVERIYDGLRVI